MGGRISHITHCGYSHRCSPVNSMDNSKKIEHVFDVCKPLFSGECLLKMNTNDHCKSPMELPHQQAMAYQGFSCTSHEVEESYTDDQIFEISPWSFEEGGGMGGPLHLEIRFGST